MWSDFNQFIYRAKLILILSSGWIAHNFGNFENLVIFSKLRVMNFNFRNLPILPMPTIACFSWNMSMSHPYWRLQMFKNRKWFEMLTKILVFRVLTTANWCMNMNLLKAHSLLDNLQTSKFVIQFNLSLQSRWKMVFYVFK